MHAVHSKRFSTYVHTHFFSALHFAICQSVRCFAVRCVRGLRCGRRGCVATRITTFYSSTPHSQSELIHPYILMRCVVLNIIICFALAIVIASSEATQLKKQSHLMQTHSKSISLKSFPSLQPNFRNSSQTLIALPAKIPSPSTARHIGRHCSVITFIEPTAYLCVCGNASAAHSLYHSGTVSDLRHFPAALKLSNQVGNLKHALRNTISGNLVENSLPNVIRSRRRRNMKGRPQISKSVRAFAFDVVHSGGLRSIRSVCAGLQGCVQVPYSSSPRKARVDIRTNASAVDSVSNALSRIGAVRHIAPASAKHTDNKLATRVVQSGISRGNTTLVSPLWDAGFDGTGELIGAGDTGLDVCADCLDKYAFFLS